MRALVRQFEPRHILKPLKVSMVVGTVLCLINDAYFIGEPLKIGLNYLTPFCVSLYSRLSSLAENGGDGGSSIDYHL